MALDTIPRLLISGEVQKWCEKPSFWGVFATVRVEYECRTISMGRFYLPHCTGVRLLLALGYSDHPTQC